MAGTRGPAIVSPWSEGSPCFCSPRARPRRSGSRRARAGKAPRPTCRRVRRRRRWRRARRDRRARLPASAASEKPPSTPWPSAKASACRRTSAGSPTACAGRATARTNDDFSLVLGGPLYQLLLRLRLVEPPVRFVARRIGVVLAITWLPVLVLSWGAGMMLGGATLPFFHDIEAQVRLLIALPLLIAAEPVVHWQLALQVRQLAERNIVAAPGRERCAATSDETMSLRNSMAIELVIVACALGAGYWIWREEFASRIGTWYMTADERLTTAGTWYAFVSLGVFRFVLFRWYFRIALWYLFLWRVSRLKLDLNALHPDGVGGIGFLGASVGALSAVLVAQSATVSGAIAGQILHEGMTLQAFRIEIVLVVVVLLAMALAPLVFFAPALLAAGIRGRREYGLLATRYVQEFRDKWLGEKGGAPLLGSADVRALADLGSEHERLARMRALPLDLRAIVRVAVIIALPFAPLVFTVIPLNELLSRILKQLI